MAGCDPRDCNATTDDFEYLRGSQTKLNTNEINIRRNREKCEPRNPLQLESPLPHIMSASSAITGVIGCSISHPSSLLSFSFSLRRYATSVSAIPHSSTSRYLVFGRSQPADTVTYLFLVRLPASSLRQHSRPFRLKYLPRKSWRAKQTFSGICKSRFGAGCRDGNRTIVQIRFVSFSAHAQLACKFDF